MAYYGSYKILPSKYPAIYEHLKQYETKLKNRGQVRKTSNGKIRSAHDFQGQHHWLELDNNPSLEKLEVFSKPVLAWQRITNSNKFVITKPGTIVLDSMAFISCKDNYLYSLLGILNSKLFLKWMQWNVHEYGSSGFRLSNQYVSAFPIKKEIITLNEKIKKMVTNHSYSEIDYLIYNQYNLTQEEINIIDNI